MCFVELSLSTSPPPLPTHRHVAAAVMYVIMSASLQSKCRPNQNRGVFWLIQAEKGWEGVGSGGEREFSLSKYSYLSPPYGIRSDQIPGIIGQSSF